MALLKVTAYMEVDDSIVDRDNSTGLTDEGFIVVMGMFAGFEEVDTELAPSRPGMPADDPAENIVDGSLAVGVVTQNGGN